MVEINKRVDILHTDLGETQSYDLQPCICVTVPEPRYGSRNRAVQRTGWITRNYRLSNIIALAVSFFAIGRCAASDLPAPPANPESPAPVNACAASPNVPAGFYKVNRGDTLQSIATAFGRDAKAIALWNQIDEDSSVLAGQVVHVAPPIVAPLVEAQRDCDGDITIGMQQQPQLSEFAPTDVTQQVSRSCGHTGAADASTPQNVDETASERATRETRSLHGATFAWPLHGTVKIPFEAKKTKGITIEGKTGEFVVAAAGGRVVYAGGRIATYGQLIIIKHNVHLLTAYGNNGTLLIKEGSVVTRGQKIAKVGVADNGNPLPVSFEIRDNGDPVDPLMFLPVQPDANNGVHAFN
ncbi:peptidoglycan DD-metalloendopeptidase family protein [Paraburkholderia susongensis]|uniref:Lipoprotein NlpD n=1 Tax=Paraburkholderia susongensis TaxID=1515439 RepID=A0A1X7M6K0_9BURK|nr:peptidoglycan DD-metalloendopeptidase family protein [Paraburkholderia susongensis]SMG61102.1 lipoprotein NlpD [Paraburkholderia susongensis]